MPSTLEDARQGLIKDLVRNFGYSEADAKDLALNPASASTRLRREDTRKYASRGTTKRAKTKLAPLPDYDPVQSKLARIEDRVQAKMDKYERGKMLAEIPRTDFADLVRPRQKWTPEPDWWVEQGKRTRAADKEYRKNRADQINRETEARRQEFRIEEEARQKRAADRMADFQQETDWRLSPDKMLDMETPEPNPLGPEGERWSYKPLQKPDRFSWGGFKLGGWNAEEIEQQRRESLEREQKYRQTGTAGESSVGRNLPDIPTPNLKNISKPSLDTLDGVLSMQRQLADNERVRRMEMEQRLAGLGEWLRGVTPVLEGYYQKYMNFAQKAGPAAQRYMNMTNVPQGAPSFK